MTLAIFHMVKSILHIALFYQLRTHSFQEMINFNLKNGKIKYVLQPVNLALILLYKQFLTSLKYAGVVEFQAPYWHSEYQTGIFATVTFTKYWTADTPSAYWSHLFYMAVWL